MAEENTSRKRYLKSYLWEDLQQNQVLKPRRTRYRHKRQKPSLASTSVQWDSSSDSDVSSCVSSLQSASSDLVADAYQSDKSDTSTNSTSTCTDFPNLPHPHYDPDSDDSSCSPVQQHEKVNHYDLAIAPPQIQEEDKPAERSGDDDCDESDESDDWVLASGSEDCEDNSSHNSSPHEVQQSDDSSDRLDEETGSDSTSTTWSDKNEAEAATEIYNRHLDELEPDDLIMRDTDVAGNDGLQTQLDDPLFPSAHITKKESLLLTIAHVLRHRLTQEALSSLLQLLQFHLPPGTQFPASKYIFNQHFDGLCGPLQCHVYCSSCSGYVGMATASCTDCGMIVDYDSSINNGNYFIIYSIAKQIKYLLQDPKIQGKISRESSEFSNGKCYQQLPVGDDDISVTWGSDGAAIFSSSNFSIWPLLLMVNELPYSLRRKHILMGGLWFGSGKPHFQSFLKPIMEEMNSLSMDGICWEDETKNQRNTKVFPGPLTCDSVARCQLQEISQFNGKYGCSWCLHPGEHVEKGNGYTHVYPLAQLNQLPRKRDEKSFIEDAQQSVESNKPVHGVKRPSVILLLLHFNIISGFVVDYMHCVCLGVGRTLTYLWLENTAMPCYIGKRMKSINETLSHLRPPSEVTRLTRTLTDRKFWKAHEWRSWLFHFSPFALRKILPNAYYQHWMGFVTAVFILMQDTIDPALIDQAELILTKFVIDYEMLYGAEYITYNVHQLIHMADSVRNWGPLWAISCFSFESMNHKLNKMISGTQYVQKQITRKFLLTGLLPHVAIHCFEENQNARHYFEQNINNFQLCKSSETDLAGVFLKGAPKLIRVGNSESFFLQQIGYTHEVVLGYDKVSFNGIKITTDKHMHKKRKRVDYYIFLKDGNIAVVKNIFLVCLSCNQIACGCRKQCMLYLSVLKQDKNFFRLNTEEISVRHEGLKGIKGHLEYKLCPLQDFDKKCFYAKFGAEEVLSVLPNNVELD